MLDPDWVFLSVALGLLGSTRYAHATLQGRVRPNRVTWSLWAAAPLIGFFAQLDTGIGRPALLTLSAGVGPLIVLAASLISRHGTARITRFDLVCGAISVMALIVWLGLGRASLAVMFAVVADAAGAVPTLRKAWHDPDSESALFFVLVAVAATITLLTITAWEPASWAFAAYLLAISIVLTATIVLRRAISRQCLPRG
ncbi:hypothetical protein [Bordetella sp. BOR01]|uniref:hypothetical protein n=1 Tax=Bordetella sp. BOR01 TaxID=2854779 RepID=UPI001C4664C1|nr:hypothetical protein [Bordetella sp. BOR01]MBV7484987.1 hypothetical protein [Bordetella sp. BOR01]